MGIKRKLNGLIRNILVVQVSATTLARRALILLAFTVLVAACSEGNENATDQVMTENLPIDSDNSLSNNYGDDVPLDAPMRWRLGPANYGVNAISWFRNTSGLGKTLFASTPFDDASNGIYAGSTVTLHLGYCNSSSDTESFTIGTSEFNIRTRQYTLVDNADLNDNCTANIVVTAGTERVPLASSRWKSTVGIISVKSGDTSIVPYPEEYDSYYYVLHVSTPEPLTLTRDQNHGTGVPNSLDHITFEMQNLHGEDLCGPSGRWC